MSKSNCRVCIHKRNIPGDCHISCVKPDWNVAMSAPDHAINSGWWLYPFNFDPIWMQVECSNFKQKVDKAP